jgi:hypothetical protein
VLHLLLEGTVFIRFLKEIFEGLSNQSGTPPLPYSLKFWIDFASVLETIPKTVDAKTFINGVVYYDITWAGSRYDDL